MKRTKDKKETFIIALVNLVGYLNGLFTKINIEQMKASEEIRKLEIIKTDFASESTLLYKTVKDVEQILLSIARNDTLTDKKKYEIESRLLNLITRFENFSQHSVIEAYVREEIVVGKA